MAKHIRCARCRFVRPDPKASDRDWTAYECGKHESEYFRALVNISEDGRRLNRIVWKGCPCGVPVKRGVAK